MAKKSTVNLKRLRNTKQTKYTFTKREHRSTHSHNKKKRFHEQSAVQDFSQNLEFKKNLLLLEKKAANLILFVLTAIFFFFFIAEKRLIGIGSTRTSGSLPEVCVFPYFIGPNLA